MRERETEKRRDLCKGVGQDLSLPLLVTEEQVESLNQPRFLEKGEDPGHVTRDPLLRFTSDAFRRVL